MTVLRIGFDDWNTLDVNFLGGRLWISSAVLTSTQSGTVVTKAKSQRIDLPPASATQLQVPPTGEGQAYNMVFAVRGFTPSEYYFKVPDTDEVLSLVYLIQNCQVAPESFEPLEAAPISMQQEIDRLQTQIDSISTGILPGGDTGYILTKNSPADGDASWQPLPVTVEGYQYNQITPLATWAIELSGWTRVPDVSIYTSLGEQVDADITASTSQVSILFPYPFAGYAILS